MMYAKSVRAREEFWKAYRLRGHPKNMAILSRMLEARKELANLLGFETWADYITGDKMIGTRQAAGEFIQKIATAADDRLTADYKALLARKQRDTPGATSVDAWDSAYLQELVKNDLYKYDSQTVRPYFEYRRVKQGVMDLTSKMFGIAFRAVPDAAVWHPDVEAFDVLEGSRVLGRVYLDMFPRDNKYKHYAQFTLINGKANRMLPEGVLVCNFPKPGSERGPSGIEGPALMQHGDVETFFHEFGHLLHHVFGGQTRWAGISGVATEWDFVEAPSQMLEHWVWDRDVLRKFSKHHKTGEPLPDNLLDAMIPAKNVSSGIATLRQMFFARLDFAYHSPGFSGDTTATLKELYPITGFPYPEGTHFQSGFGHLFGYDAGYYGYLWSRVFGDDMFTRFESAGVLDATTGLDYRRKILERGGSVDGDELVRDFLGREPNSDAFLRELGLEGITETA
jgi:thimet oligopeptidase